jgi:thymidine kinase
MSKKIAATQPHSTRIINQNSRLTVRMSLELIVGPMFAGKSSAILSRVRRARTLDWSCFIVTCAIDTRYDASGASIMTHDKEGVSAFGAKLLSEIKDKSEYKDARLVIIEEGQFFPDLLEFVKHAVDVEKKDVVVVGLDGDSERKKFGQMLDLIPLCDKVTKLTSLCKRCGDGTAAIFSACVKGDKHGQQVCVGGADMYEPMCRKHFLENQSV